MATKLRLLVACVLVLNACGQGPLAERAMSQTPTTVRSTDITRASTPTTAPFRTATPSTLASTTPLTNDVFGEGCPKPTVFSGGGADVSSADLAAFESDGTRLWTMTLPSGVGHSLVGSSPFVLIVGWGVAAIDANTCAVLWEDRTERYQAVATEDASFLYTDNRELTRVDNDFNVLWRVETALSSDLAILGDLVLLVTIEGLDVRYLADGTSISVELLPGEPHLTTVADVQDGDGALIVSVDRILRTNFEGKRIWVDLFGSPIVDAAFVGDSVAVLEEDNLSVLDGQNGTVRWTASIPGTTQPLLFVHDEIHVLTDDGLFRHYDLDGNLIFESTHTSDRTFLEFDDGVLIETHGAVLSAFSPLEHLMWSVEPDERGSCPLNEIDVVGEIIVTLTYVRAGC